jgi:small subunit ribosomal protein S25e
MKEVPTYKMISQSILIERMKINGSVARKAMRHLETEGLIKKVVHHHGQWVYSEFGCGPFFFVSLLCWWWWLQVMWSCL